MPRTEQNERRSLAEDKKYNKMNVTKHRLDSQCSMEANNLFKNDADVKEAFKLNFEQNCYGKRTCAISTDLVTEFISEECVQRYEVLNFTGKDFLVIASCGTDSLDFLGWRANK